MILVDSTDPIGPAAPLFGDEFYKNIYNCLSDNGIVVSQGESPFYMPEMQKKLTSILANHFNVVKLYNYNNLTYPGGMWTFSFASKNLNPLKDFNNEAFELDNLKFQYYTKDLHKASFYLPQFMLNNLGEFLSND